MVDHEKILSKSHFDPEKALSASRSRQCGAAENRVGAMAEGVAEVTFEVDPSEACPGFLRGPLFAAMFRDGKSSYLAGVPLERHRRVHLLPCGCKPGISST